MTRRRLPSARQGSDTGGCTETVVAHGVRPVSAVLVTGARSAVGAGWTTLSPHGRTSQNCVNAKLADLTLYEVGE